MICKTAVEMTLFQDTGGDPRPSPHAFAGVLVWYGALGDAALGNAPGFALRKASVAVSLASSSAFDDQTLSALRAAGILHAIGAIGNRACRKGEELSERTARMELWDVPVQGARLCERIAALPAAAADMVRWQSECWDGTGFPDQLRWHGIPMAAQFLGLADAYVRVLDPEEALSAIGMQSGRAFGPHIVHAFTMWFHRHTPDVEESGVELDVSLDASDAETLLDAIADRVDEHNGVPGRWRRVESLAAATAERIGLGAGEIRAIRIASRLFGAGEVQARYAEDARFDPLGRLGIEERAHNAAAAAAFAEPYPIFADATAILRARGEWYDGTGKPLGLSRSSLPPAAGILAAAIAYERLDRGDRLDEAAGTQFEPRIVRALLETARRHA
jgi:response regulator RpfG family c-di-GMP phosphodiesterase